MNVTGSLTKWQRWCVLFAVMLAFLPVVIDMTILHVAVPTLTQDLRATNTDVLWIIDIYPLLMAGLVVPMGTLADRVGARKILLIGLLVFGVASSWAAFTTSAIELIAARGLLAVGGSMIMPTVLATIRKTFEDEKERATALGLWGMVGAAGAALGPLIGGGLLAHFWWGSVFLINVPIMLVVVTACYFLLPRGEVTISGKWPIGQALILIIGMMTFVYGAKAGFGGKQSLAIVAAFLLSGFVLLTVFVQIQLRAKDPMLDLTLFTRPAILAGIILALVVSGSFAGVELTLAQELQYVLGKTPLQAGVFLIPIMAAAAVGGPFAGRLSNRFGLRVVVTCALIVAGASLATISQLDFHDPGVLVPTLLGIIGLSLSIGLTGSSIAIMGSVEAEKGGAAGSLEATAYELGSGLGIAVFGMFMSATFRSAIKLPAELAPDLADQAARSIGDTFIVADQVAGEVGQIIADAGRSAFVATHASLLLTSGVVLCLLAIAVNMLLSQYDQGKAAS